MYADLDEWRIAIIVAAATGMPVVKEADPQNACFREADVHARGRRNDLRIVMRKEIASFLSIDNFCLARDIQHKTLKCKVREYIL